MTDVVGAHYRGEEKIAQDGLNGLGYAMACILSGHDDVVLFMAHCKESQSESRRTCTNLAYDPFFLRPLGLDFLNVTLCRPGLTWQKAALRTRTWPTSWFAPERTRPGIPLPGPTPW